MYCCLFQLSVYVIFFFFKQKTAYEMRISDWSSDVCSSDLRSSRRTDAADHRLCHASRAACGVRCAGEGGRAKWSWYPRDLCRTAGRILYRARPAVGLAARRWGDLPAPAHLPADPLYPRTAADRFFARLVRSGDEIGRA